MPFRTALRVALLLGLSVSRAGALEEFLVQPGPEGEDVAAYGFIPTLARGNRETNWVFSSTQDGQNHSFEFFVRFPLPSPPPGHVVDYAYAFFYHSFDDSGFGEGAATGTATIRCHQVLEDWEELEVTWLNRPAVAPAFDVWPGIDGFGLFFCDVRDLVEAWLAGTPNYGISLTNPTDREIGMYSFEATLAPSADYRPSLLIGFEPAGGSFDVDRDGARDARDNCVYAPNAEQSDADADGFGDPCDVCPTAFDPEQADADGDGVGDACGFSAADIDGDGTVHPMDYGICWVRRGTFYGQIVFPDGCDLDGDETVTDADLELYLPIYLQHFTGTECGLLGLEPFALLVPLWARRRRFRGNR